MVQFESYLRRVLRKTRLFSSYKWPYCLPAQVCKAVDERKTRRHEDIKMTQRRHKPIATPRRKASGAPKKTVRWNEGCDDSKTWNRRHEDNILDVWGHILYWCEVYYFIYTSYHFTPQGRYELNKLTSLPMCGFIAQLVEQRTGNAEVTGSNPVEALIFFSGFFFPIGNSLRWSFFTFIYCTVILLPCYLVTFLLCPLVILSLCYPVTLFLCSLVTLLSIFLF